MTTQDQVVAPALFTFNNVVFPLADGKSAEVFFNEVCAQFENKQIEQDSQGNVYVMAPAGGESSDQNSELTEQLRAWSKKNGRGTCFDSSVSFILPDGSKRSPDASWVSIEKLKTLTREERRKFLKLVPEFVAEIKSPTDRWSDLQAKMQDYRRNGVTLGWLIHPDKRTVELYRQDAVEVLKEPDQLAGEGPISYFVLNLKPIWEGLTF